MSVLFKELLDMNQTIFAGGSQSSLAVMLFDEYGIFTNGFSAMSEDGVEPFGGFCQNSVGDTFIAFTFIGQLAFDEVGSVDSNGGGDIVVAKYDENSWTWLQQAGGTGDDLVNGCVAGAGLDVQVYGTIEVIRRLVQITVRPHNGSMHSEPILPRMERGTDSSLRVVPVTTCTVQRTKQHPVP